MVYCLKCGNMIDDGEVTCFKCGARKNCNSEVFELNENNGFLERCKCFVSKWRQRT